MWFFKNLCGLTIFSYTDQYKLLITLGFSFISSEYVDFSYSVSEMWGIMENFLHTVVILNLKFHCLSNYILLVIKII